MQWKSESRAVMSDSLRPMDYTVHGILQARRDLPNPGIKSRSPILQADSLPTELSGKLMQWNTTTKKRQTTNRCNNVINCKDITLREISQAQNSTYYMIPFIRS